MKFPALSLLFFSILLFTFKPVISHSQDIPLHPALIRTGVFHGLTPPLRDIPAMSAEEFDKLKAKAEKKALNRKLEFRSYPFAATALPKGPDQAWQNFMGATDGPKAPVVNFSGQNSPYYPPDCNGTAGPDHFMQTVNTVYAIYNKTGTLVAGPSNMNSLFSGVTGATCNDGDPLVLYDEQAGRWLAVEFSLCGNNDYMLIAVSTSSDPTGSWYKYSFDVADVPDYEKFGIWQDGYYMATNNDAGNDIYVFQRSQMLIGGTAQMVGFDNAWRPTTLDGFMCVPPVDNDGAFAPAGSPGLFITINDDAIAGGSDQLWVYELAVDWATPSASTFVRTQQIDVTTFDSDFGITWDNISQPNAQKLDAIPQVIMNVPQYRNFGTYQTIVCCHTVDVDATNHAGIRWYELRKTPPETTWSIRQQGTYAPDEHSRWMGSIMLDGSNHIGLGYSVSSSTVYPGIRYCGQSVGAYVNATGIMDFTEEIIQTGAYAQQSGYNRWGDYSLMSVDPTDDKTFWFTTQYIGSGGTRETKIASFKFDDRPSATTLAATSITETSATLNGIINPNGLATTCYFQWGTTTAYGNTTANSSIGSGTSYLNVSVNLTGLTGGTTYHFRVIGVNSDGTSEGNDMTVIPGAATVTTTPVTSITYTTASSGGNVINDGGSAVMARGVCWGTEANPAVTGNHTTDGSGTGTYTSSISGLSAGTTYHVRAYATNGFGTYYGEDIAFTTLCESSVLPFTESFSGTIIPNCWSQVDHQDNGQIWQFGTISGYSPYDPNLNGNYAYLNSDAYGSGNSQNADLVTPTLNLSAYSAVTLQFNHYFRAYPGSSGKLSYSTNNGTSWTQIASYTKSSSTNPVAFSQAINAVAGQSQVKFKWNYTGSWGFYWAVDDVQITGTCTTTIPVSVSITGSANPVCTNTSVTFTATPVNGGTSPSYQWKVNGINAGTNNPAYSYIPLNNDAVTCVLTSNAPCVSGNPATSNTLTMTVTPPLTSNFIADKLTPQKNDPVQFTDLTTGNPTTWLWSFDRPGVVYLNGTSASSQNPQVKFTDGGLYSVTLMTNNLYCSDSEIKPGYLRAGIPGLWTGYTSSDWNTLSNWDNYLTPDASTDLVIPSSASFWPVFQGDFIVGIHCRNLILSSPASRITINGNLTIP
jgi:hypothetical protein